MVNRCCRSSLACGPASLGRIPSSRGFDADATPSPSRERLTLFRRWPWRFGTYQGHALLLKSINGHSQTLHFKRNTGSSPPPKAYHLNGSEVFTKRIGNALVLISRDDPWTFFVHGLDAFEPGSNVSPPAALGGKLAGNRVRQAILWLFVARQCLTSRQHSSTISKTAPASRDPSSPANPHSCKSDAIAHPPGLVQE